MAKKVYVLWWDNNTPIYDDYEKDIVGIFSCKMKAFKQENFYKEKCDLHYSRFWVEECELNTILNNF